VLGEPFGTELSYRVPLAVGVTLKGDLFGPWAQDAKLTKLPS
jgi:hypothetical protein